MTRTTYRRPTTVHRGGKTFPRRGGQVRYTPAADGYRWSPPPEWRAAASSLLSWVADVTDALKHAPGARRKRAEDRRMLELVRERHELRGRLHSLEGDERLAARRRIQEIDNAWRASTGRERDESDVCTDALNDDTIEPSSTGRPAMYNDHVIDHSDAEELPEHWTIVDTTDGQKIGPLKSDAAARQVIDEVGDSFSGAECAIGCPHPDCTS